MADEAKKDAEAKPLEEKKAPEKTEEKTMGEIINDNSGGDKKPTGEKKPEPETVPLASLLEYKKDNKELRKDIEILRKQIEDGVSKKEITTNIQELADKFNIDPEFISEFKKSIMAEARKDAEAEAEKKAEEKMRPLLEEKEKLSKKERDELIDKAFQTHYTKALENMPEYAEIANADAIKALSLLPQNANKTFRQLIEETYGKAIPGKRTIDSITPGGGKEPAPLDFDKARKDTEYFKEVMANPELKAEYNKRMLEPNRRH